MKNAMLLDAANGDAVAINGVMTEAIPYIRSVVKLYYARERLSWNDSEDLVQDVLLDVYTHLDACKDMTWSKFISWLRLATIHEVYRMVEKQSAKKRGGGGGSHGGRIAQYEDSEPIHRRTPEMIMEEKEQNAEVLRLVAGLDESQRDVFLMALDGAASKDISEELGIPVTTVYRLAKTAKARLREIASQVATCVAVRELVQGLSVSDAELVGSAFN